MGDENDFIRVVIDEESEEIFEFPKEDDDTVFLSTLQAQFPHAIGLKYRSSSGAWRGLSANENVFAPPKGGWLDDVTYVLTLSEEKKRKSEMESNIASKKPKTNSLLQDMVVMNLPFQTTDEEMKAYFEKNFGPVLFAEIKKYHDTGKSRGYGFIRFKEEDDARNAVSSDHELNGRKIEVRQKEDKPMKLFIGRLPGGTTAETLKEFFSEFGEVTDSWIPTPFRNFGFLTFASTQVAKNVMAETHYFNGSRLNIVEREPDRSRKVENRPAGDKFDNSSSRYDPRSTSRYDPRSTNDPRSTSSRYDPRSTNDARSTSINFGAQRESAPTGGGGMDKDLKQLLIQVLQQS